MSGAAARTGDLKGKERNKYIGNGVCTVVRKINKQQTRRKRKL